MGMPAAKRGDQVVATDMHMVQPSSGTPFLAPHPFAGILDGNLSSNVKIMGRPAAIVNSTATNTPRHVPVGGTFVKPPANRGTIVSGSATVSINGSPAARSGDTAVTCNDPVDKTEGKIVAAGTVMIG